MKTLFCITSLIILLLSSQSWSSNKNHTHNNETLPTTKQTQGTQHTPCENVITVTVHGLVCDFCARALEKVFGRRDDVLGIDVNLDKGNVKIAMKDGKMMNDATVRRLISDSGYNIVSINKGC